MSEPLLVLRVNGRPPDLHHGKHISRWTRAREQGMRRSFVKVMAQGARHGAELEPCGREKRRLHVVVFWRGIKRDDVNLLQDLKADFDGLVDAGWLRDDNREWLQLDYPPEYQPALTEQQVGVEYRLYSL